MAHRRDHRSHDHRPVSPSAIASANGCHWACSCAPGQVDTDAGIKALARGCGARGRARVKDWPATSGHDAFHRKGAVSRSRTRPPASKQPHPAPRGARFAFLDVMASTGRPGHARRGSSRAVALLPPTFLRHPTNDARDGEVRTASSWASRALKDEHGSTATSARLVFPPDHELLLRALAMLSLPQPALRPHAASLERRPPRPGGEDLRNDSSRIPSGV